MAQTPDDRVRVLAVRVDWLNRYRRLVAIAVAAAVFGLFTYELVTLLGSQWPSFMGASVSLLFSTAVWWIVEVALAWLTAYWETEHAILTRDPPLPRAELVQRRR